MKHEKWCLEKTVTFGTFLPLVNFRSSRPDVFCKKGVLEYFAKFTGKHLRQVLFLNKIAGLTQRQN